MKYASTMLVAGVETVVVVLPLSAVPLFDPENPPQENTYGVSDEVQVGWVKNVQGGFEPPPGGASGEAALIASLSVQIQKRLDDFAKTRRYDNVTSGSKYDDLTDAEIAVMPSELQAIVTRYRAESRYLKLITAQTWAKGEILTAEVLTGQRPIPSSIEDFVGDLPSLSWPV